MLTASGTGGSVTDRFGAQRDVRACGRNAVPPSHHEGVIHCKITPVAHLLHVGTIGAMTRTISQRELRNDSGEIMRALDRGEDFIVTRNGVPVGELRPARRRFVSRDLLVQTFRTAPAIDADRFREDLDAVADQDIEPVA